MDRHFVRLHHTSNEDWLVCVEHINAIRCNHDKANPEDNGVWIYLLGDTYPIKVTETINEVVDILSKVER